MRSVAEKRAKVRDIFFPQKVKGPRGRDARRSLAVLMTAVHQEGVRPVTYLGTVEPRSHGAHWAGGARIARSH